MTALDPAPWRLTAHCRERMEQMGLRRREVIATVENPAIVYQQNDRNNPDAMVALGGRLCVPHNPHERVIITVTWRSHERSEDRNTPPEERMTTKQSTPERAAAGKRAAETAEFYRREAEKDVRRAANPDSNYYCTAKDSGGEHQWGAELDGSTCENGCGTGYDEWSEE